MSTELTTLQAARDDFIAEWGAMGSAWGINRTMAQIHALLMVTPNAMSTDDLMTELRISRGNANQNLRELVGWGLVRGIIRKGERREYFEAERDVWRIFTIIVRERKRREIEPVSAALQRCRESTEGLKGAEASAFRAQVRALEEFVALSSKVMDRIAAGSESRILPMFMKLLK